MSDWFTYPERKIYLEDVRFNSKDITLIVAWFVADSLKPQNVAEAQSLQKHERLMHVAAICPVITAYASYRAGTPRTPDTTDSEEEGIEFEASMDNYINAKMKEVLEKMKSLI